MVLDRRRFLKRSAVTTTGLAAIGGSAGTAAASDVPLVSTRGHFDDSGELEDGYGTFEYETSGDVPGVDTGCAGDLTVFVHGWHKKGDDAEQSAHDKISHARSELTGSGYDGTVVGYTWDNDVGSDTSDYGWGEAQKAAQGNGPKLAQFAVDFGYACPNARIRFVSHSLGAQVLLSSLRSLNGSWFTDNGYELSSTHLLGAAQDNEAPTQEWADTYDAIANVVVGAFDYHSHEDDVLQWIYNSYEFDQALGETGYEDGNTPAPNYNEYDATSQVGHDHSSYLDTLSDEIVYHMEHVGSYV